MRKAWEGAPAEEAKPGDLPVPLPGIPLEMGVRRWMDLRLFAVLLRRRAGFFFAAGAVPQSKEWEGDQ